MDQSARYTSTEANLDIQYTLPFVHPMRTHFYSIGGRGPLVPDADQPDVNKSQLEPFAVYFDHLLEEKDSTKLPHTITISYGDNEQSFPVSYTQSVCNQIAQLGARGVSLLVASGDEGVGSACLTNDGKNTTRFTPVFPSTCPYITSVGGTYGINPERGISLSSGGFSERFERPAYQEAQVSKYLDAEGAKWAQYYNAKGRGFPDISAQARNFRIVDKGRTSRVAGTSASSPVVAAIVALLNAKRLQDGQPALGFLNPWLYASGPKIATDITDGKSTGCTGRSIHSFQPGGRVQGANWPAIPGWDPVTGVGTPKFGEMLKHLPAVKAKIGE
jgi:tripeptidyl-peptidase-1